MNKIEVNLPIKGSVRIAMNANQVISLAEHHDMAIESVSGEFWVTLANDAADYVLAPGERLELHGRGSMVAQAMSEAELMLIENPSASNTDGRRATVSELTAQTSSRQRGRGSQLLEVAVNCWRDHFTRLSPYVNIERAF